MAALGRIVPVRVAVGEAVGLAEAPRGPSARGSCDGAVTPIRLPGLPGASEVRMFRVCALRMSSIMSARIMRAVRQAGNNWAQVKGAHRLAPPIRLCARLRALADAAASEQVAWEYAYAAGLPWRPVAGAGLDSATTVAL
jgi:hypothetical protein